MWLPNVNIGLAMMVSATTNENKMLLRILGDAAKLLYNQPTEKI